MFYEVIYIVIYIVHNYEKKENCTTPIKVGSFYCTYIFHPWLGLFPIMAKTAVIVGFACMFPITVKKDNFPITVVSYTVVSYNGRFDRYRGLTIITSPL